jgi:hypothetical protein
MENNTNNSKELEKRVNKLRKEIESPKKRIGRPSNAIVATGMKTMQNPLIETHMLSPEKENKAKIEMAAQLVTLADLSNKLTSARERLSVESRLQDVEYVKQLDAFISVVLEALAEVNKRPALLKRVVRDIVKNGQFTKLRDLMTTVGIAADKRNAFLSYDEARSPLSKKKLKLNIVWKKEPMTGAIEQGGIQAEVEE